MIMPDEDIRVLLQWCSLFEFALDGGYDPTSGISTFGWVASINSTVIAQGRGPPSAILPWPSLSEQKVTELHHQGNLHGT
jgi:hypothetical protein